MKNLTEIKDCHNRNCKYFSHTLASEKKPNLKMENDSI